ncbi:MAG: hypothetical protein M3256_06040 [Actinomycetota bacterium]|nr:hypothetical protein [Actinomycetota bacterium]
MVRTAGYHADGDVDNDGGFFVNLFPDWLLLVSAWATSEHHHDLASAASDARVAYLPIARRIVPAEPAAD